MGKKSKTKPPKPTRESTNEERLEYLKKASPSLTDLYFDTKIEIPVPDHPVELPVVTLEPGDKDFMLMDNAKPTDPGVYIGLIHFGPEDRTFKVVWSAKHAERAKMVDRAAYAGLLDYMRE